MLQSLRIGLILVPLLLAIQGNAFSLLGPFAFWMEESMGYGLRNEIGGPMNLGEEYRWNVPVVTCGFDSSFVDYFGTNGILAVEEAIKILNDLPPASQVAITTYPSDSLEKNYQAQMQGLMDLKTTALALLVEQMGLASAGQYTFCIRSYWEKPGITNVLVIRRNFDPRTWLPTSYLNGGLLTYRCPGCW